MAAGNLFKKAAAYRKKHKGMSMPDAVKAVSKGAKVSGTKKRKPAARKIAAAPKRRKAAVSGTRTRSKTKRVYTTKAAPRKTQTMGEKALHVVHRIDRLEVRYKGASPEEKKILALIINQEHDNLDRLKKRLAGK